MPETTNLSSADTDAAEIDETSTTRKTTRVAKSCGSNGVKPIPYNELDTGDRLTTHRSGYVEMLNAMVKKPKGAVPHPYLPEWQIMPMANKIPRVPAPDDAFLWSRGNLCKPLPRHLKKFYNDDPLNKEKVVTGPYNALHDAGTERYFKKPVIKELIFSQGFITADEKVLCSLKEFNDYRRYLCKSQYAEALAGAQDARDQMLAKQRLQMFELRRDISKTEGKQFEHDQRIFKAKHIQDLAEQMRLRNFEKKQKDDEFKELMRQKHLQEQQVRRRFEGLLRDRQRDAKIEVLKRQRLQDTACLVNRLVQKDRQSELYIEANRRIKEATRQEFLMIWLKQKWKLQEQRIHREKCINESIRKNVQQKAEKRQKRVEKYRALLPQILAKRKAEEDRIWAIVRKYFYRWVENVRKRKARRPDALHKSLWDIPMVFDETVKYLRKESGYEKFDDFILSIVKLKQNIRQELEKEEAAERGGQMISEAPSAATTVL